MELDHGCSVIKVGFKYKQTALVSCWTKKMDRILDYYICLYLFFCIH
jgi:hypothetical protein